MPDSLTSKPETVLVTGGSGFLGGHAITQLLDEGYVVRATVRDLERAPGIHAALTGHRADRPDLTFFEADLGADAGWGEAVTGCKYALHIASPFPAGQPKDPQELIRPARDGALRVIEAALDAGVDRVVMTSSTAAVRNGATPPASGILTEKDWSDPDLPGLTPYARSKTISERAAWDLVEGTGNSDRLAVVNPSAILGPVQGAEDSTSLQLIQRLLNGMPGVPRLGFSYVDVRDTADLHIRAMTALEAGGQRFIASGPFLWMNDVSGILREGLPDEAAKAPSRIVPKPLMRILGLFDPGVRSMIGEIGKESHFSADKARRILGWEPRPIEQTIIDCGKSLSSK